MKAAVATLEAPKREGADDPPATAGAQAKPGKVHRVQVSAAVKASRRLAQIPERARQMAALILDVLGGNRTPADAARAMGLSAARYYVLEQRAIHGLVSACQTEPKRGPGEDLQNRINRLERDNRGLEQALRRQQAVVRTTQRGLGVTFPRPATPAADPDGRGGKKRRTRRPMVRALRLAKLVAPAPALSPTAPEAGSLAGDQRGG